MYECKICNKKFEKRISLERHVTVSYGKSNNGHLPILAYMAEYEGKREFSKKSLENMYINQRMSTPQISIALKINKVTLLGTMKYYGIKTRDMSEAARNQIARDGLWNKGKTKADHPSIMKYAKSRCGKNNPYFTAPGFKERHHKSIERFKGIQKKCIGNHNPKTTEVRMKKVLDDNKIQYLHNFYLKFKNTWRWYDFLIEGKLMVEMQGNYFHANPKIYDPEDTIRISKKAKLAKEIWAYDEEKKQKALSMGYSYIAIWEDCFTQMTDSEALCAVERKLRGSA